MSQQPVPEWQTQTIRAIANGMPWSDEGKRNYIGFMECLLSIPDEPEEKG